MEPDAERLRRELWEARGDQAVTLLHALSEAPDTPQVALDADVAWVLAAAHRANEDGDYPRARAFCEEALSRDLSDHPAHLAVALVESAVAAFHVGSVAECAELCSRGLTVVPTLDPPSPVLHAQFEAQRAIALKQQGLREGALELNLRGLGRLDGIDTRKARELRATLHNNIATIYIAQGDDKAGIEHLERGIEAMHDLPDSGLVEVVATLNLGRLQLRDGDARAAATLEHGARLAEKTGQQKVRMYACEALSAARRKEGRLDEAEALIREVVTFWIDTEEAVPRGRSLLALGEVLVDRGAPEAEAVLLEAADLAREPGLIEIENLACATLARFYEAESRFEEACAMHRRREELQKQAFDQQRSRQIEELRAAHETAAREKEAEVLRVRTEELAELVHKRTIDLEERNAELVVARDAAQAASRAKSAFLAVVSHELRTPLNAIVGYAELVRDDALSGEVHPGEVAVDLGRILDSAGRLRGLVDRILMLTEIEAGEVRLARAEVDLGRLLEERVSAHRPRAEHQGLALTLVNEVDGPVLTDGERVVQIVDQLLINALAFTAQGAIEVRAERDADSVQVAVRDTGVGIDPADLDAMLDPLSQGDMSYTRTHEGLGLGLALSAAQCRVLGGRLDATSVPGQGSTFRVVLPT